MTQVLHEQCFVDARIDLTGKVVTSCLFDGCVVEVNAGPATHIRGCSFQSCELIGDGWPEPWLVVDLPPL